MRYRFGDCVFDTDLRALLRRGRPAHLSPKAYELVTLLLERRPNAVSKRDIEERLWPRTYVTEGNLARPVYEVRAATGDEARRPDLVRTVHGFGYAFSGTATDADEEPKATASAPFACRLIWGRKKIGLGEGEHVLGRDPDADIRIDAPSVSRRHARIVVAGAAATIEDLGSKNGTYRGSERIRTLVPLADSDEIRLGNVPMIFRVLSPAASTETVGHE